MSSVMIDSSSVSVKSARQLRRNMSLKSQIGRNTHLDGDMQLVVINTNDIRPATHCCANLYGVLGFYGSRLTYGRPFGCLRNRTGSKLEATVLVGNCTSASTSAKDWMTTQRRFSDAGSAHGRHSTAPLEACKRVAIARNETISNNSCCLSHMAWGWSIVGRCRPYSPKWRVTVRLLRQSLASPQPGLVEWPANSFWQLCNVSTNAAMGTPLSSGGHRGHKAIWANVRTTVNGQDLSAVP